MKQFLALSLLAASAVAWAGGDAKPAVKPAAKAPAKSAVSDKIPAPLQMAVMGGMKIEKSFSAAGGLTGWILSQGVGNNMVVYTSPDGQVAIAGNMLDASGKNLTKQYLDQHAPKPDYSKMWGELEKSTWVAEGSGKSIVYVFKDPNCGYCHLAWKALQPYVKAGLQVRWVPVAFLAPDSYDKAATMVNAKDGEAAVAEIHANYGKKVAVPAASAEARAKLEANNKLMNSWGFRGTPAMLYKDKTGTVKAIPGMFSLSQLPEITGLPEQANNDPQLERFR